MFASGLNKTLDARQASQHTTAVDPTNTQEQRAVTIKDYVLIAAALNSARPQFLEEPPTCDEQHALDVLAIADALARDNPRFDRERFLKAAGVAP